MGTARIAERVPKRAREGMIPDVVETVELADDLLCGGVVAHLKLRVVAQVLRQISSWKKYRLCCGERRRLDGVVVEDCDLRQQNED